MVHEPNFDPMTLLPTWVAKEKDLAHLLPYGERPVICFSV